MVVFVLVLEILAFDGELREQLARHDARILANSVWCSYQLSLLLGVHLKHSFSWSLLQLKDASNFELPLKNAVVRTLCRCRVLLMMQNESCCYQ